MMQQGINCRAGSGSRDQAAVYRVRGELGPLEHCPRCIEGASVHTVGLDNHHRKSSPANTRRPILNDRYDVNTCINRY